MASSLAELEALVVELHAPTVPGSRQAVEAKFAAFEADPNAWKQCVVWLQATSNPYAVFHACAVLTKTVRGKWEALTEADRGALTALVSSMLETRFGGLPHFAAGKVVQLRVAIAQQDFPHRDPGFLDAVLGWVGNPAATPLGLSVLQATVEEFSGCSGHGTVVQARRDQLKRLLTDALARLCAALLSVLGACSGGGAAADAVAVQALNVLAQLVSWAPMADHLTPPLVTCLLEVVARGLAPHAPPSAVLASVASMQTLTEVICKRLVPPAYASFVMDVGGQVLAGLQSVVERLTTLDANLRGSFLGFVGAFFRVHLARLESAPGFPMAGLLDVWLKHTLAQPDLDGFLGCLEVWASIVEHAVEGSTPEPFLPSITTLVQVLLDRMLFTKHGAGLAGIDDTVEDDAVTAGRGPPRPLADALNDELDDWVASSDDALPAGGDAIVTDLDAYLSQCVEVVALASGLPRAAEAVVGRLLPELLALAGAAKAGFSGSPPAGAPDPRWVVRDVATMLSLVSTMVPSFRAAHFAALRHPVDAPPSAPTSAPVADDTVDPRKAESLLDCVVDVLHTGTVARVHTVSALHVTLLVRSLACVKHFFSWMDARLASLAPADAAYAPACEWASRRLDSMLQAVLRALDASVSPPPETVIDAAMGTLSALSFMSANTRTIAIRTPTFGWLSNECGNVIVALPLTAQARLLAALLRLHLQQKAPEMEGVAGRLLGPLVAVVATAGAGVDARGVSSVKKAVMVLSGVCTGLRTATTPVKAGVYEVLQPCVPACTALFSALLGLTASAPRLVTTIVSTTGEVLRLLCIAVDALRAQVVESQLGEVVSMCSATMAAALTAGVLTHPVTKKPSMVGCALLRNFFRLLRVCSEHRGSAALLPAVLSVCSNDGLQAVVTSPQYADEVAPAYCGAVVQVLTVHWRKLAVKPPPTPGGVGFTAARPQTFASPDAASHFASVMAVVLRGVGPDVSPALLRMYIRVLLVLNKRIRLFTFPPFATGMSEQFQLALLRTMGDQQFHTVRDDVVSTVHTMVSPSMKQFVEGVLPKFLASLGWLPDGGRPLLVTMAGATDAPSFSTALTAVFNDIAVAFKRVV